jgi:HD-GYP domain-containing protein (c-di-GMP phosphodiesterase class II)
MSTGNRALEKHATEVARFARLTAQRLGLSASEVDRVELAALLHDVGKTTIPDSVLGKPGQLDPEEWRLMRTHTLVGERIVLGAAPLAHVAGLVRSSHERFDGAGYPDGLAGDAIPRGARIIAVCDAYDAMTIGRPYRAAIPRLAALAELRRASGRQFDALVVDAFSIATVSAPAHLAQAG